MAELDIDRAKADAALKNEPFAAALPEGRYLDDREQALPGRHGAASQNAIAVIAKTLMIAETAQSHY